MTILSLDLASDIGWAIRAPDGGVVCGTDDVGERYKHSGLHFFVLRCWLARIARQAEISKIVFKESDAAVHRAWLPHLTEFCERTGATLQSVAPGAIKKHIAGKGSASREAVFAAVEALGHKPANDAEAIAVALLLYAETSGKA